jgi:hypothetical protein
LDYYRFERSKAGALSAKQSEVAATLCDIDSREVYFSSLPESFNEVCGRRLPKRSLSMPAYKLIGLEIVRLMAKDTVLFSWKERLERAGYS